MTLADITQLYPIYPGSKKEGTSEEAAPTPRQAKTLREAVLEILRRTYPMTADEIAGALDKSILSIRPRTSELIALGKIKPTGQRRRNDSGKMADVLDVTC